MTASTPLRLSLLGAVSLGFFGLWLDCSAASQPKLFAGLFGASLLGAAAGVAWRWPQLPQRGLAVALAGLVWRLSYFPVMVFSGFVASIGEAALSSLHPSLALIYPVFLLAVFAQHGIIAFFVLAALLPPRPETEASWWRRCLSPPRRWVLGLSLPMLLVAALVSFNGLEDLRPWPDLPHPGTLEIPAPQAPRSNPYLPRVLEKGLAPPQRVLLFCAGMTYPLIPHSPWAYVVKGTLESLARRNPDASSSQRVLEHYQGYLAAHRFIRKRRSLRPLAPAARR